MVHWDCRRRWDNLFVGIPSDEQGSSGRAMNNDRRRKAKQMYSSYARDHQLKQQHQQQLCRVRRHWSREVLGSLLTVITRPSSGHEPRNSRALASKQSNDGGWTLIITRSHPKNPRPADGRRLRPGTPDPTLVEPTYEAQNLLASEEITANEDHLTEYDPTGILDSIEEEDEEDEEDVGVVMGKSVGRTDDRGPTALRECRIAGRAYHRPRISDGKGTPSKPLTKATGYLVRNPIPAKQPDSRVVYEINDGEDTADSIGLLISTDEPDLDHKRHHRRPTWRDVEKQDADGDGHASLPSEKGWDRKQTENISLSSSSSSSSLNRSIIDSSSHDHQDAQPTKPEVDNLASPASSILRVGDYPRPQNESVDQVMKGLLNLLTEITA